METKRLVRIIIFVVIIFAVFIFVPKGPVVEDSGAQVVMGTFARVVAVGRHRDISQRAIDRALEQIRYIETIANVHDANSEISKINSLARLEPVKVSDDMFEILKASIDYGRLTNGAFDVAVGPLVYMWQKAGEANQPPDANQLSAMLKEVDYQKLYLNPVDRTVQFGADGMKLDLGGIAKGYAIDRAIEAMKDVGAFGGMVDIGGDIRCFGTPANAARNWIIGLQDPAANNRNIIVLKLDDLAVATSGDYRRFVLVGGKKHSHIIDSHTGQSAEQLSSVSVIAPKGVDADALATAVSVMGTDEGLKLIESIKNTDAIIISPAPDYKITVTEGAEKYISKSRTKVNIYKTQND
ncbi:MAG: FAD:protein FMN transferase [Phycisphaerae bacterium]|jgi:thiamine biosynthesis lipoprotein